MTAETMTVEQAREIKDRLVEKLFTPEMTDADMVLLNRANDVIRNHKAAQEQADDR